MLANSLRDAGPKNQLWRLRARTAFESCILVKRSNSERRHYLARSRASRALAMLRFGSALIRVHLRSLVLLALTVLTAPLLLAQRSETLPASANGFDGGLVLGVSDVIVSPGTGGQATKLLGAPTFGETGAGFPFGLSFDAEVRTAAGELSGDTVPDIVVAMGAGGSLVRLYNGATLSEIASGYPFGPAFVGGVSVATGDLDGDGRADIIVGQASRGGMLTAFSGRDISVLVSIAPFGAGYAGGLNVASGDVDGDGRDDVIVGQATGGSVSIISGATRQALLTGAAYGPLPGGVFVAAGDVTGDGRAEVITAPGTGPLPIIVYDVRSGSVVTTLTPYANAPGGARIAVNDTTGDGRMEIFTVPGPGAQPELRVYDGATFATLSSRLVYPASYLGGSFLSTVPSSTLRFVSAAATSFQSGVASTFSVAVRGYPPATTIEQTGTLPSGIAFTSQGNGMATLAGTATASGMFNLTFTASNTYGRSTQNFVLTVGQAPAITSASSTTFTAGAAGTFTVGSSGFPAPALSLSGALPSGLTFVDHGDGTGTLAGTPAAGSGGSYLLTINAVNGLGAGASQALTLTVNAAPTFTSSATGTFGVGAAGSFTVTATGYPVPVITLMGALPAGVTFTHNGNGSATLAGTPAAGTGGVHPLSLAADNGVGTPATQNFSLTVTAPPAIVSSSSTTFAVGVSGSFSIATTGYPAPTINTSGNLPAGLTVTSANNGTATLAGTPSVGTGGVYALTVSASNGSGTPATQTLAVTVNAAPAITSAATAAFAIGHAGSFSMTSTGVPTPTISVAGTLPAGVAVTFHGNGTAMLAGTPLPGTAGSYPLIVTAANGVGTNATQALTLTVDVGADAQDESYSNGVGNTQYSVGAGTPPTPAIVVSGSVLNNDTGVAPLSAGPSSIVTAHGGQVQMAANGTFLYTPPVGFAGPSDSFTYVLTDGSGGTDTSTVTINLGAVVWYVNASASGGDGRSQSPFSSMTAAATAAQAGQTIYVHQGAPTGATALKSNQTLWGSGATFALNGLSIAATAAPVLQGTVTLANGVLVRALSINGGVAAAVVGTGISGSQVLNGVSVVGGLTGLSFSNVGGTITVTGGSISGVSGTDVDINGGTAAIAIGASVSNTVGRSIAVQNLAGGSVTFSAPIADTGLGVLLQNNSSATISFSGGMAISTASSDAFTSIGGGTLAVTQNNTTVVNTLASAGGQALVVRNSTIGATGLTFRSISAGGGGYTPGIGIVLDQTGSIGGLTVVGNGTADSGGVIRRKSGADGSTTSGMAVFLRNTTAASLRWMRFSDLDNGAIVGSQVANFSLQDSVLDGTQGTSATEGGLRFGAPDPQPLAGVSGAVLLHNVVATGSAGHGAAFFAQSDAMTLQIGGTSRPACGFSSNSTSSGGDGLHIQLQNTATATVTVDKCQFRDDRDAGIRGLAEGMSDLTITVSEVDFVHRPTGQGQSGVVLKNSGDAHVTAHVTGSQFESLPGANVWLGQEPFNASSASLLRATITANQGFSQPVGATEPPIVLALSSSLGEVARSRLLIENQGNTLSPVLETIRVTTGDSGTSPAADVTLLNNHTDVGDAVNGPYSVTIEATQPGANVCTNVRDNTFHWLPTSGTGGPLLVRQGNGAAFRLERGAALLSDPVATVLTTNNPLTTNQVIGSIAVVENGTCVLPSAP